MVINLPEMQKKQEKQVPSMGQEDLEEGMATHSSILAWRIPCTEGTSRLLVQNIHIKKNPEH